MTAGYTGAGDDGAWQNALREPGNGYTSVYALCYSLMMKNVGIRIRVEKELRAVFLAACQAESRQASEVLREFMKAYADQHQGGLQGSLFAAQPRKSGRGRMKNG